MSASLIATDISVSEVVGSLLVGASLVLTTHSLSRMIFLRRTASKYHLFPIINVAQFVNQLCVFFLITTAFQTISFRSALWLNVINNVAYFITKPTTMYLAYLRCSAVFSPFRKWRWLHFGFISIRAVELFGIIIVNIVQNEMCQGSVAKGTKCEGMAVAWLIRDVGAPIFRAYYIVCEGIFYFKLFKTLKGMTAGKKNVQLIQYRRLQTSLFTVDLILLVFMSIYRIIGIFNKTLPTYVYYELFSSTLTIFNLTEFGLNIRVLFHSVGEGKTNSGTHSSGTSPSKLEMGSVTPSSNIHGNSNSPRQSQGHHHSHPDSLASKSRTMTHNSSSPLTSFAADTGYSNTPSSPRKPYHPHQHDYSTPAPLPVPSPSSPRTSSQHQPQPHTSSANLSEWLRAPSNLHSTNSSASSPSTSAHPTSTHLATSAATRPLSPNQDHIIAPSNFQYQSQISFDGASSSDPQRISRPSRALVPPERFSARH